MLNREQLLRDLDEEIARLQQMKNLLIGVPTAVASRRTTIKSAIPRVGARAMSAADRKKRSDAQKKRWADRKAAQAAQGVAKSGDSPSSTQTATQKTGRRISTKRTKASK
jgi:hypothetical protein